MAPSFLLFGTIGFTYFVLNIFVSDFHGLFNHTWGNLFVTPKLLLDAVGWQR
jgi:hypothetical protein